RERAGAPVWHPDVRFFEIADSAGEAVGSFYLDAYARPHKRAGAWMDECVGRKRLTSGAALPVAYLVCNFLPPGAARPALLTHDDVLTLFHEFGHGLHHLLTRVDYPSLAGINGVAWDAVELPSQFLENYAWHPEVLQRISGHFESGAPLPAQTQSRLIATRSFHAGLQMMRQLEFALFDFRLHTEYSPERGARVQQLLREVRDEAAVVPVPEWNRFANSFGHIFAGGYAAGYYSYKWAEVLAADAFAAFEESGVFDRATAQRFLEAILSRGGSRDALEAFIEFRGRRPDVAALLKQHGIVATGERAAGGKEGWIRASYLSAEEPLRSRLAQRTAEVAQLKEEVSRLQAQLDAARTASTAASGGGGTASTAAPASAPAAEDPTAAPQRALFAAAEQDSPRRVWPWVLGAALLALCAGFALGALVLDRYIRRKYGGLRIY